MLPAAGSDAAVHPYPQPAIRAPMIAQAVAPLPPGQRRAAAGEEGRVFWDEPRHDRPPPVSTRKSLASCPNGGC